MLTYLQIENFTLVEQQEINLMAGLTVLTGETGAGKSILLDALGLAIGDRADANRVRKGAKQAQIHAAFDIDRQPRAKAWLARADINTDECILRRVITSEGRSRAYINGCPVTQSQLKSLGETLLEIHGQHAHQSLLSCVTQRRLLDNFGAHGKLVERVKRAHESLADVERRLEHIRAHAEQINARHQLLSYQASELDDLGLQAGELDELEQRQKRLAHAEMFQVTCQQSAEACIGMDQSIGAQLHKVIASLSRLPYLSERTLSVKSMLQEAKIQVEEAGRELELEAEAGDGEYDLASVEARLSAIYDIARKHRVQPAELTNLQWEVSEELKQLEHSETAIETLEAERQKASAEYSAAAAQLREARHKAGKKLAQEVNQRLQQLAMPDATLSIELKPLAGAGRHGSESVEFLIRTIPGHPPDALGKVASGGELSRIGLAIAVVTAATSTVPTLVFDEVDAGIGGATGNVVGQMLHELGNSAQILCVTHLPQVASKAGHHFTVEKHITKKSAHAGIRHLQAEDRVLELARMMGGAIDSEQSLAHARQMLSIA